MVIFSETLTETITIENLKLTSNISANSMKETNVIVEQFDGIY